MKVSKKLIKKVNRIAKAADLVHNLNVKLKQYFGKLGISEEVTQDSLTSLCYGDISGEEFISGMIETIEEYKD